MSRRTPTPQTPPGHAERTGARALEEPRHDPYRPAGKLAEPTRCGTCGAVCHLGRWQWIEAAPDAHARECPACRRIRDRAPAGWLTLDGAYVARHRTTLVQLARAKADQERSEHPLNRIMEIEEHPDRIEITTTDIHLPRRIGAALERAHDGALTIDFAKDAYEVRVRWHR